MTSHLNGTEALGTEPALALVGDVAPLPVEELNNHTSSILADRCVELCQRTHEYVHVDGNRIEIRSQDQDFLISQSSYNTASIVRNRNQPVTTTAKHTIVFML